MNWNELDQCGFSEAARETSVAAPFQRRSLDIKGTGIAADARLPTGSLTVSGEAHAAIPCRACAIIGERSEASSKPLLCSSAFIANSGGHSVDCCSCDNRPLVTPMSPASFVSEGDAGSAR